MKAKLQAQRPKWAEFIEFRLCASGAFDHAVYKWLRGQAAFQRAQGKFCRLKTGKADCAAIEPGSEADQALLEFAQRVSYCFGHFLNETASHIWTGPAKARKDAARDYSRMLSHLEKGFGPYDQESRDQLKQLLIAARDYLLGKHLSSGFRLKGGSAQTAGILIRELTAHLEYFELPQALLTSIIIDLVDLAGEIVDPKTVQRHVKAVRSSS